MRHGGCGEGGREATLGWWGAVFPSSMRSFSPRRASTKSAALTRFVSPQKPLPTCPARLCPLKPRRPPQPIPSLTRKLFKASVLALMSQGLPAFPLKLLKFWRFWR